MENKMSDLNPEDRALLDLARDGREPTDGDRRRVRVALLTRLGVGTGLISTTAATSKAATALMLTKVFATVAVAGAIGGTGVATYRATHSAGTQVVAPSSAAAHEEHANAVPLAALPPTIPGSQETTSPANAPRPSSDESSRAQATQVAKRTGEAIAHRAAAADSPLAAWPTDLPSRPQEATSTLPDVPTTTSVPIALLPPTTLEAETRLVRGGVAALHAGNTVRALALFDEHARAFPNGALAEERAAERVVALGALRRCDEARAAAVEFLRDHPHSPLSARVRESCAHTPNP
jgi:hypothetical protein